MTRIYCQLKSVNFILSLIPEFGNIFCKKMSKEKSKIFMAPENGEEKEPENPIGMRFSMIFVFENNQRIVEKWGKERGIVVI